MLGAIPWSKFSQSDFVDESRKIRDFWGSVREKIIVLDDDPTGCQTVHDVPVYLQWDTEAIEEIFHGEDHLVYILTNIRSLPPREAEEVHQEIAELLIAASRDMDIKIRIISRSDSTLRGHFPEDLRPFFTRYPSRIDGVIFVPAFFEGGRYTFHGTHYVKMGDSVVPAHETEFAKDDAFGFRSSYLPEWVSDKWTEMCPEDVDILSVDTIRSQQKNGIREVLSRLQNRQILCVDALDEFDLQQVTLALLERQEAGQNFLFRSAASFVQTYAGISQQDVLKPDQILEEDKAGGLVIVGSYVQKTSQQLVQLLQLPNTVPIELDVQEIVFGKSHDVVSRTAEEIEHHLRHGQDCICYTSRNLLLGSSSEESLRIGEKVSEALVGIVQGIHVRPSFLIAKGGITSHVVAEIGLKIRKALVLGKAYPGVPVWECDSHSKWPGLRYVVFPGNVGDDSAVAEIVHNLQEHRLAVVNSDTDNSASESVTENN